MNYFKGFIIAFKKTNKSHFAQRKLSDKKAQSIFEYVILTAVVAALVLIFADSAYFIGIKDACKKAFDRAVEDIVK